MASTTVRHAEFYIDSRKVAEISSGTVAYDAAHEQLFGDDGVIGLSDGAATLEMDFTLVTPISGYEIDFINALVTNKLITATTIIGGKQLKSVGKLTSGNWKSDSKTGTLTGDFKFKNGEKPVAL